MKILGIHSGMDAGAAVLDGGRVLSCISEERLSRKKLHWGVPERAIVEVLNRSGVGPGEIEHLAVANQTNGGGIYKDFYDASLTRKMADWASLIPACRTMGFAQAYRWWAMRRRSEPELMPFLASLGFNLKPRFIEHHTCHGAAAYYGSPFPAERADEVLVVTSDGVGDGLSSTIAVIENGRLKRTNATMIFHSPGAIYAYVTHNLGFKYHRHEGKITGLAAYGDYTKTIDLFRELISWDEPNLRLVSGLKAWGRPGAKRLHMKLQALKREDIAAGLQRAVEEAVSQWIGAACARYGKKLVCVSGGLFANVRVNQWVRERPEVEDIYVHQNMGDGGHPLGAALELRAELVGGSGPIELPHVYLGPAYTNEEIGQVLAGSGLPHTRFEDVHAEIARLLAEGKIIARFTGAMEYGPRALGHRSILYHTADQTVNKWLNEKLERTEFMPFAPLVLKERAGEYFKGYDPERSFTANFMTITYDVTEKCAQESPAITHIDKTARPQLVDQATAPDSYGILKAYEKLTGDPILINTSFNMHEEPIVCTPAEGVRAFVKSKLDVLAIGDYIVFQQD